MRITMAASTATISSAFSLELISLPSARRPLARARARSGRARDRRRHGSRLVLRRPALALLHELIERQIQHVAAPFGVHQHLRRGREDLLERLEIQALAGDRRRLLILAEDVAEAVRLAFGVGDDPLPVRLRLLLLAGGRAAGERQDPITVFLGAQDRALAVFPRLHGVL